MNHRYMDFVPQNQPKEEIPESKPVLHISFVDLDAEPEYPEETYVTEEISDEEYIAENEPAEQILITPISIEEELDTAPELVEEFDLDTPIEDLMVEKTENVDFGVVEDYVPVNGDQKKSAFISMTPTFTNTKVEKRPLFKPKTEIEEIKSQNLLKKAPEKETPKVEEKPNTSFVTPKKSPFINTNLVEKRPLSKTNYRDRTPVAPEEETGPVTIIDNKDKGGRLGLILTIILTIILGAAVGTIAFLLIPR